MTEARRAPRYHQLAWAADLLGRHVPDGLILDSGCGQGLLARLLPGRRVLGLDLQPHRDWQPATRPPTARFIVADMRFLPVKGGLAHGVALIGTLGAMHGDDIVRVLREANRALAAGGHVVLLVSRRGPYSAVTPERLLTRWRWNHFRAAELRRALEEAGFCPLIIAYKGGILSVIGDLLRLGWSGLGQVVRPFRRLTVVSSLLVRVHNLAEGLEFRHALPGLARYIFVVARRSS